MKLSALYKKALAIGVEHDPRGSAAVAQELERRKKEYEALGGRAKETFDTESLDNPYADSRILYGSGDEEIAALLVGIDIDVGEVLLADRLRAKGTAVDLILAHHPGGKGLAGLAAVMSMQADILQQVGVPINIAEGLMESRIKEVDRRVMPANHTRTADAARLLEIPFACLHTPADNMVATYLQRLFDEKRPYTLDDVVDALRDIPEYREAEAIGAGPRILLGAKRRKAGKIFVDMTGGTEGAKDIFQSLSLGGVNTIVGMHLSEEHRKEAEKHHLNVVIAGHIASDNVGLNLLLDELMTEEHLTVVACSGFRRIQRQRTGGTV